MNRFSGKVALVTGASRGIGRAIAEAYLEEGAKVALCARSLAELETLAEAWNRKDRRAIALKCDVTSREEVALALEEVERSWGKLHILVNNAGISGRTPLSAPGEDTDVLWDRILATNLSGSYLVTRHALPLMSSGDGRIVNMSSVLGRFGVPGYAAYCTAKHGIIGFTRALALELAPRGITVNALCPGWVETDMADQGIRETAAVLGVSPEAFREHAIAEVPLKRFLDPAEIAKLVLYLTSDDASAITGQAYNICGGQVMS
ncbi:MAG TPA: SDR family NAD(P)-dependent oxidoreductase [Vicinamibacteria bacterium]|nr:SDR family NAD(P)-dependent oxidoreductase [Vicinamibacteria bacterium]